MVVRGTDCRMQPAKVNHHWIFWFGDYRISEVRCDRIILMVGNFSDLYKGSRGKKYQHAVLEGLRLCAQYSNLQVPDLMKWALDGFPEVNGDTLQQNKTGHIPAEVQVILNKIYGDDSSTDSYVTDEDLPEDHVKSLTKVFSKSLTPRNESPAQNLETGRKRKSHMCGSDSDSSYSSEKQIFGQVKKCKSIEQYTAAQRNFIITPEGLCQNSSNFGDLVWAKFSSPVWWPAMIIPGPLCGMEPARSKYRWIFWFGDHRVSELPRGNIMPFSENFSDMFMNKKPHGRGYWRAILEALDECQNRSGHIQTDPIKWAVNHFDELDPGIFQPDTTNPISNNVQIYLDEIAEMNESSEEDNDIQQVEKFDRSSKQDKKKIRNSSEVLALLKADKLAIRNLCISCYTEKDVINQHPMFDGGLCLKCSKAWMKVVFSFGTDGTPVYCVICSGGGDLFVCSNTSCLKVYCRVCISDFLGEAGFRKVDDNPDWSCFMCLEWSKDSHGLVHRKEDWEENVRRMFTFSSDLPPRLLGKCTRPLRVLSHCTWIVKGKKV